ncbi:MAG: DUF3017 domain-containing protein [Actinomycetia bacterium]|nr:DUF3017 domain-containing protein [Actinomycetes bacterium]MCH9801498.1 DUF3017 domain-containing protein [Actinomycetes bacterium]
MTANEHSDDEAPAGPHPFNPEPLDPVDERADSAGELEVASQGPDEPVDVPLNVVALQGVTARERGRPLILVLLLAVSGLALMLVDFRLGTLILAGSATTALILRAVLPTRRAGLLVVRTRTIDLTILSALTGSLLLLALITPAQ